MNQREAMRETFDLAVKNGMDNCLVETVGCDYTHLIDMYERILVADIDPDQKPFSEVKLGRWLGWIQCAVVAAGFGSLEDMKQINKKWRADDATTS